jgi:hypothetical protein
MAATATLRWVLQLHRDVPRAARFYAEGLDFSVNVCTLRWAELQSGPLKLALMHTNDRLALFSSCSGVFVTIWCLELVDGMRRLRGPIERHCTPVALRATRFVCSMKCVCALVFLGKRR